MTKRGDRPSKRELQKARAKESPAAIEKVAEAAVEPVDLDGMTKAELLTLANGYGIEIASRMTKTGLRAAIKAYFS